MVTELPRRPVWLLSLDVVGFSRMMAIDDMRAVSALRDCRNAIKAEVDLHRGRLFGSAGDGFMIEFGAAIDAVSCAIAIQHRLRARNAAVPADDQIWLRSGIAGGLVIDDDGNLFGDAVNIAARLQEVCPNGGVLVTQAAREALAEQFRFRGVGELRLKNIPNPIELFEVLDSDRPVSARGEADHSLAVIPGMEAAPFIAIFPLANATDDSELDAVCRGFSEDLITTISHLRQFPVIDRNSSFAYVSGAPNAHASARKLGARYLLEGALQRADGQSATISAQLTDLEAGSVIWAEAYAPAADDILETLDETALRIVATLGGRLEKAEGARSRARRESRIGTRGLVWRSRWHLDQLTRRDSEEARRLLLEAEAMDPSDPEVLLQTAHWRWIDVWTQRRPQEEVIELRELALAARRAAPNDGRGPLMVGNAEILLRNVTTALENFSEAIRLNPSLALGHAQLGSCYLALGDAEAGIAQLNMALRLSPQDYYVFYVYGELAVCYCMLGEWEKAISFARKALALRPAYWNARMSEITALLYSGDRRGAAHAFDALKKRTPKFSRSYIDWLPYQKKSLTEFFVDAVERASAYNEAAAGDGGD